VCGKFCMLCVRGIPVFNTNRGWEVRVGLNAPRDLSNKVRGAMEENRDSH
jgi:hypothetical protein